MLLNAWPSQSTTAHLAVPSSPTRPRPPCTPATIVGPIALAHRVTAAPRRAATRSRPPERREPPAGRRLPRPLLPAARAVTARTGARAAARAGGGGAGGNNGSTATAAACAAPGPRTIPSITAPGPKTTATVEPCSALPAVLPTQATVGAPAATGAHGKPCKPLVVANTATSTVPGATPAGTVALSVQAMLAVTVPLPLTAPLTAARSPPPARSPAPPSGCAASPWPSRSERWCVWAAVWLWSSACS